jgi:DNA-3-methyladenine glycosylase
MGDDSSAMKPLTREFYDREPTLVARELLGKLLIRRTRAGECVGRVVEVEAYLAVGDSSCHSYRGRNRKNATMFGPPGFLYVYPIHSRHCMNTVTQAEGVASAVLIRALEPVEGIALMQRRRGTEKLRELLTGPARLCEALDVDRRLDGWDLTRGTQIWIAESPGLVAGRPEIAVSRRIGVTSAEDFELRFFYAGNPYVSGPRRIGAVRRA